jgi:4-amino-4-deoxy-L-arabinose transferase-like glycosyltransferase
MERNQKRDYIFLILVGVLFFLRGLQLQCIYPPLEGPDEYQHIAYLTYIEEQGQIPAFGKATVPKSLYPYLLANPHCKHDWEQTGKMGCLQYKDFYEQQALQTGDPNIQLYEAQQPAFYYVLASPVFAYLRDTFSFRAAIYTLRIINIAMGAIAMIFLLSPLKGIFEDARPLRLGILAISLSPMFMIYVSRVANDAPALFFAGLAVNVLTRMSNQKHLIVKAAIAGGLVGIGVLTKMTVLCILPAAVVYFLYFAMSSRMSFRNAVFCSVAAISCYLIFTMQYHLHSFRDFGTLFPEQDTIQNTKTGRTLLDLAGYMRFSHLNDFFLRMIQDTLWTSGWSFLSPREVFRVTYNWFLLVSILGILPYIIFTILRPPPRRPWLHPHIVLCGLLVIFSFVALYGHALHAVAVWGVITTLSYYLMISYPAFLICVLAATRGYGKIGVPAAATVLAVLFLWTEYSSLLGKAAKHWTGATEFHLIFERLASVHPLFPGPYFFFPLAIVVCSLAVVLMFNGFSADKQYQTGYLVKNV